MANKLRSLEYCLNGFLREVDKRSEVDPYTGFSDRNVVRRYNASYDRAAKHVQYIDEHYPDSIHKLIELLDYPNIRVVQLLAPMLLRLNNTTVEHKEMALQAIKQVIENPETDPLDRFGFQCALPQWEKELYGNKTADSSPSQSPNF